MTGTKKEKSNYQKSLRELRTYFFALCFLYHGGILSAQNISINTTGAANSTLSILELLQISVTADTKGLHVDHSGPVTTGSGIGYGIWSQKTGASTTNIAGYFTASGAANNYALIVPGNGGNVGIGTTAPTNILSLGGNTARTIWMERTTTAATAGFGLTLQAGGAIAGTNNLTGGDLTLSSGIATGTGTSRIYFSTTTAGASGNADRFSSVKMTILGNGDVGIGTTSPDTRLTIAPPANAWATIGLRSTSGGGSLIYMGDNGAYNGGIGWNQQIGAAMQFYTNADFSASKMILTSAGNVGIGTSTPSSKLTVGNAGAALNNWVPELLVSTPSGGHAGLAVQYAGTTEAYIYADPTGSYFGNYTNSDMYFLTNDVIRMTIKNGGNLGIGTTTPLAGLEVNATTAFTSAAIALAGDNQTVTPATTYIQLSSNNATSTNRTIVLADGTRVGQILILHGPAANACELQDSDVNSNADLNVIWTVSADANMIITLLWNGTSWLELSRINN